MTVYACRHPGCVGVTTRKEGECSPHAQGYRKHPEHGGGDLRCAQCRRLINPGWWYRLVDGEIRHLRECTPHKDVIERRTRDADLRAQAKRNVAP